MDFRTHPSISEIDQDTWNALGGPADVPCLRWEFLKALEDTGCTLPERGWAPCHLTLWDGDVLIVAAPAYIKGNSEGEFVFDHAWAQFAQDRLRIDYYPKLIVAVPFTPVTGPRLLIRPGDEQRTDLFEAFTSGVSQLLKAFKLSSAHLLFPESAQAMQLEAAGFGLRRGIQFHWRNQNYGSFEDFLSCYPSRKRKEIKKERRALAEQNLRIEFCERDAVDASVLDAAYQFYVSTVDKYFWGRRYLNREFFEAIGSSLRKELLVVLAKDTSGRAVAGAFNLRGTQCLYGRYWGTHTDHKYLHFNVCYYAGIEYCIEHGLEVFEPGAGGEHKLARGFAPTETYSLHALAEPRLAAAIGDFLVREGRAVQRELAEHPQLLRPFPIAE